MGRAKITVRKAHFKRPSPEALEVRARPEWPSWEVAEPGPARTHHTPRATPSASLTARRRGPSVSGASARDQVLMAPFSPQVLSEHGYGQITTEIREGQTFYYAEYYHQQYLSKNPDGYCGLGGTGVSCPLGIKK